VRPQPFWIVGGPTLLPQDPAQRDQGETFTLGDVKAALGKITPTLLLMGIATGAAFAIGGGLVSRFVFRDRK